MLYLRTAAGDFVNAATIVQLSEQRGNDTGEITGWLAICSDGKAVALAPYYAAPGRIELVRDHLPAAASARAEYRPMRRVTHLS